MNASEWIETITRDTAREISKRAGISERTVQHQLASGKISAENVIKIADAYGRHPLRALIDTGYVPESWAHVPDIVGALRLASEEQLTDEVLRRLLEGRVAKDSLLNTPVDELATVLGLPERHLIAAREGEKGVPDYIAPGEEDQQHPDDEA